MLRARNPDCAALHPGTIDRLPRVSLRFTRATCWLLFSGGLNVNAKEPEAGRALLKFLTTPAALAVFKANGLEPP